MTPDDLTEFLDRCRALATDPSCPGCPWSWDARFESVLTTFPADRVAAVQAWLAAHLPSRWDRGSLHRAPESVRKRAVEMGGVRLDQRMLCSDVSKPVLLAGAWWPWGGGQTISLRLMPLFEGPEPADRESTLSAFRDCFGL